MKTAFVLLLLALILIVPVIFSVSTFEITRIKITFFELIMPWIFFLWIYMNIKKKFKTLASLPIPVLILWGGFFLFGVCLYFKNEFKAICFEQSILNTLFFMFTLAVLEENVSKEKIHKFIFLSSIIVFLYGTLQIYGINLLKHGEEFLENGRIFSTLANPNDLALYAGLIFFLGLYYVFEKKKKFMLLLVVWAFIMLIFSKSGSGIWGVLFSGMLLSLSFKKSVRILLFFLFLVILITVLTSTVCIKTDSVFYRNYLWEDVLRMIGEKPVLGWGLGSFAYVYPGFRNPELFLLLEDHQIEFLHPDNYYLNLAVEGGIIYLLLFVAMNVILFYYLLKYNGSRLCFYYFAIMGGMLFQNIISQSLHSFAAYFLYALMFGLALCEVKDVTRIKKRKTLYFNNLAYQTMLGICVVLNIVIMYFSLRIFASDFYLRKAVYDSQVGRLNEAVPFYHKAIRFNYFNPLSHYLMGNIYLEKGSDEDLYNALKSYSDVENIAGNYLQVYAFKGLAYHRLHDEEQADFYFNKVLLNDPYLYYQIKYYIENQS
ncbi:MAG: O-antigen ligase family protein [Candidatus Saelkia tenebricola]|nr:O-antigen ligase family protein [Candidatus Saelkia tenebricola]